MKKEKQTYNFKIKTDPELGLKRFILFILSLFILFNIFGIIAGIFQGMGEDIDLCFGLRRVHLLLPGIPVGCVVSSFLSEPLILTY